MGEDRLMQQNSKLRLFYVTSVLSMIFAVIGFSYNTWRMQVTEENNNIRTASFEVLSRLSEMEQLIYTAHYDKNTIDGSPRKIWVKVGLIVDLSGLISPQVEKEAESLKSLWRASWQNVREDEETTQQLVVKIDLVRKNIKQVLKSLQ